MAGIGLLVWAETGGAPGIAGAMLAVGLLAGIGMFGTLESRGAETPPFQELVRTRRLEVVDPGGQVRARIAVLPDSGPTISLIGSDGKACATLSTFPDGNPVLNLAGPEGKASIQITLLSGGRPVVAFWDREGKQRVMLALYADGRPVLTFYDQGEHPLWSAP